MTSPAGFRCGVLGSPIVHSLSPMLHRAAYVALGLDWEYDAYEVTSAGLDAFVQDRDDSWRGLSLTMPLKQAAGALCAWVEPLATRLGSVNTMVRRPDGGWDGHNTDVGGCVDALREVGVDQVSSGLVVGAGATAASALAALARLGAGEVTVLARSIERARWLVDLGAGLDVSVRVEGLGAVGPGARRSDVLVSTVPATAQTAFAEALTDRAEVVFDVVYEPRDTPLLAAATRQGRTTVTGLALLLHQAGRQVVLMTGCDEAPLDAMRAALD